MAKNYRYPRKIKQNQKENVAIPNYYPCTAISDREALKIHGIYSEDRNDYISDSDSGNNSFDDEYYLNKPEPLPINRSNVVTIKAKSQNILNNYGQLQGDNSYNTAQTLPQAQFLDAAVPANSISTRTGFFRTHTRPLRDNVVNNQNTLSGTSNANDGTTSKKSFGMQNISIIPNISCNIHIGTPTASQRLFQETRENYTIQHGNKNVHNNGPTSSTKMVAVQNFLHNGPNISSISHIEGSTTSQNLSQRIIKNSASHCRHFNIQNHRSTSPNERVDVQNPSGAISHNQNPNTSQKLTGKTLENYPKINYPLTSSIKRVDLQNVFHTSNFSETEIPAISQRLTHQKTVESCARHSKKITNITPDTHSLKGNVVDIQNAVSGAPMRIANANDRSTSSNTSVGLHNLSVIPNISCSSHIETVSTLQRSIQETNENYTKINYPSTSSVKRVDLQNVFHTSNFSSTSQTEVPATSQRLTRKRVENNARHSKGISNDISRNIPHHTLTKRPTQVPEHSMANNRKTKSKVRNIQASDIITNQPVSLHSNSAVNRHLVDRIVMSQNEPGLTRNSLSTVSSENFRENVNQNDSTSETVLLGAQGMFWRKLLDFILCKTC